MRDDLTVPGEGVPLMVAIALTLGGSACAVAATVWYQERTLAPVVAGPASGAPASLSTGSAAPATARSTASEAPKRVPDAAVASAARPASAQSAAPTTLAPASAAPISVAVASAAPASAAPASAMPASAAPASAAPASVAGLMPSGRCLLGTTIFRKGSKRPKPGQVPMLKKTLQWLAKDGKRRLLLRGHSDAGGTDGYNLRLSAARARWVRAWILERGVRPERVTVQALGEFMPVIDARPEDARQRRVEIFGLHGTCGPN